jgi:hypothetical protein
MMGMNVSEQIKLLLRPKKTVVKARLFVTREDGITIYDTVQNETTASVSALVSGVWQASEALVSLAHPKQDVLEFRLAFDTSSQGIYLFPFNINGKRYFLGALYLDCMNPGQLKHQVSLIKEEMDKFFLEHSATPQVPVKNSTREGFLFNDISDEEIDRLFTPGGI